MKIQARKGVSSSGGAVVIVALVIAGLAGSVVLQITGSLPNPIGKAVLDQFGGTSSLSVEGCLFNSDGSLIPSSCQTNSGGAVPLSLLVSSGGGGGGCYSTTKGVGWGMSAVPTFTGSVTSITFSGTETVSFNGATLATVPVSQTVNNPTSGQSYSIKALGADLSSTGVLGATNCVAGSYTFTMSSPVTMSVHFADGTIQTKTATGSGSMPITVSTSDSITGLSITATGGSFA